MEMVLFLLTSSLNFDMKMLCNLWRIGWIVDWIVRLSLIDSDRDDSDSDSDRDDGFLNICRNH